MIASSVTPESRLSQSPPLLPSAPSLDHYRALFDARDFLIPIRNSLIVAAMTTIVALPVAALCAYAIARLRFRGRAVLLALILVVSMFPQISIVPPLYLILRELRLLDTYPGLVLPYVTFSAPLAVWLLTGFLRQLSPVLEEAAMLDGASRIRAQWDVVFAARGTRYRNRRHPDLSVLLERVSLRPLLHARPGPLHRAGGDHTLPRPVPGALLDLVEPRGYDHLLHLRLDAPAATPFLVVVAGVIPPAVGTPVFDRIPPDRLLLFDGRNGARLP